MVSEDPMYCYFSVDERSLLLIRRHMAESPDTAETLTTVKLELADGTLYPSPGKIDFLENQIDPDTGTLLARARFPNPDRMLAPGLFARVRLPFVHPQAVLVPERAVQRDMTGAYVLVVLDNNTVERRYLELGPLAGEQRIVLGGLASDARVIVQGLQRVRPGITVQTQAMGEAKGL